MKRAILSLVAFLVLGIGANATDLALNGNWSFNIDYSSKRVHLQGDNIINKSSGGYSGTIKLQLYFTTEQYVEGGITGYVLCEEKFDNLTAGYQYNNINDNIGFYNQPPTGSYYVTLILAEYEDGQYVIRDHLNFDNRIAFNNTGLTDALSELSESLNRLNNQSNQGNQNLYNPPPVNNSNQADNRQRPEPKCGYCKGSGECPYCNRAGQSLACVNNSFGVRCTDSYCIAKNHRCKHCNGSHVCSNCHGKGYR